MPAGRKPGLVMEFTCIPLKYGIQRRHFAPQPVGCCHGVEMAPSIQFAIDAEANACGCRWVFPNKDGAICSGRIEGMPRTREDSACAHSNAFLGGRVI